jgi:hypothetical protein
LADYSGDDPKEAPDLVARVKEEKRKFESKYGSWRKEARENYDMVAGDGRQWKKEDREALEAMDRPCVEFDRLGTIVDAVSGSEINNRQETSYIPRIPGSVQQQGMGATTTAAARWVRDNCDAEDEESDAFVDVLIAGVGCTHTRMDYEEDEEGQILIERKDILRMGWDATATKRNNADAKCAWEECKFSKEEIESRWPDKAEDIAFTSDISTEDDADELRVVNPATKYEKDDQQTASKGLVDVTHFQWYEVDQIYKVLTPEGQIIELDKERFEAVAQINPQIQHAKVPRRRYMEAFICGNVELESGKLCDKASKPAKDFSFQFITGKRDRNKGYWYGLVRPGKDPQRWANKFFSQILHIINTNAKGGVLAETGAVTNTKKFEDDWAKSDAVQWLNPGGLGKIEPKQPAQIPNSLFQTMEFAISSIRDCTGVNLELLGLVDRQQAGVLEAQRTQAGLTILAPFFSSLRHYRKRQGRVLAYFINEYISDGRLIRVAGPEGEQFIPLMRQTEDVDFEMVVDSAPTARDTKEQTWAAILPVLGMMQQQGIMPPPEVLDYLPVPISLAQKFKQAFMQHMQKVQQGDPKQEAMFGADLANKAADAEQKESAAAANYMKAGQAGIQALQLLFGPQQPPQGPPSPPATVQ